MEIHVQNRQETHDVASYLSAITAAARCALVACDLEAHDVSIVLVSDPELHRLNRDFLGHDYPTDVVTFPLYDEDDPDPLLGEVVISVDRAHEEAAEREISVEEELRRYAVHGVLHLAGYDDRTDSDRVAMHARQEAILTKALRA